MITLKNIPLPLQAHAEVLKYEAGEAHDPEGVDADDQEDLEDQDDEDHQERKRQMALRQKKAEEEMYRKNHAVRVGQENAEALKYENELQRREEEERAQMRGEVRMI